jgi:hypothetical protein
MQFQDSRCSGRYWNQRNVKYTSEASALETTSAVLVGRAEDTYKGREVDGHTSVTALCSSLCLEARLQTAFCFAHTFCVICLETQRICFM